MRQLRHWHLFRGRGKHLHLLPSGDLSSKHRLDELRELRGGNFRGIDRSDRVVQLRELCRRDLLRLGRDFLQQLRRGEIPGDHRRVELLIVLVGDILGNHGKHVLQLRCRHIRAGIQHFAVLQLFGGNVFGGGGELLLELFNGDLPVKRGLDELPKLCERDLPGRHEGLIVGGLLQLCCGRLLGRCRRLLHGMRIWHLPINDGLVELLELRGGRLFHCGSVKLHDLCRRHVSGQLGIVQLRELRRGEYLVYWRECLLELPRWHLPGKLGCACLRQL